MKHHHPAMTLQTFNLQRFADVCGQNSTASGSERVRAVTDSPTDGTATRSLPLAVLSGSPAQPAALNCNPL
jgi:hypothetical protein